MPVSDQYGRAFEYCVAEVTLLKLREIFDEKVKMTKRAEKDQQRGRKLFESLHGLQKKQFVESGQKISKWLVIYKIKNFDTQRIEVVEFDKIPDVAGVSGDVTDIRIKFISPESSDLVNVSLKHRHTALKHPRLTRVPRWIGTDPAVEEQYLKDYNSIWISFFEKGKRLVPHAQKFRELKERDSTFIEENLYDPLYRLIKNFLRQNLQRSSQVQQMFDFLVGKFSYVKFIDRNGKIEVRDFSNIPKPSKVDITYEKGGYLYLLFNNGWKISGRLHTATQWLKKSIKFDMKSVNLDSVMPAVYI